MQDFEDGSVVSVKDLGIRLRNIATSGITDLLDHYWALEELEWDIEHLELDVDSLDQLKA
jgi:hypothetical protein